MACLPQQILKIQTPLVCLQNRVRASNTFDPSDHCNTMCALNANRMGHTRHWRDRVDLCMDEPNSRLTSLDCENLYCKTIPTYKLLHAIFRCAYTRP